MTNNTESAMTPQGIITSSPLPFLDATVERDGITYQGRVYPVTATLQRIPLRCPDCTKIIAMRESDKVLVWCRSCGKWHSPL